MPDETIRIIIEGRDQLSRPATVASRALTGLQTAANGAQQHLHGLRTTAPVLQQVSQGAQRAGHSMQQAAGAAHSMHGGMLDMAKGMLLSMAIMKGIDITLGAVGTAIVGMNARLEQSRIGWTTLLKSAGAAEDMLTDLKKFAATTPFEFPELDDAARRLLAMGFAAEEVIPTMTTVGNAAAALGSGQVGIERITRALGQMRARMKVSAEEMIQFTEVGVPAWEILAEAMGKSVGEVMELTKEGKVASKTFIDAFNAFSKQNWGDMMARQARTYLGALSTIKDNTALAAAQAFKPLFERLSQFAISIADFTQTATFEKWADQIARDMETAFEAIRLSVERVGGAWKALGEDGRRNIMLIAGLLVARGPLLMGVRSGIKGLELLGTAFKLLALTAAGRLSLIGIAAAAMFGAVYENLEGLSIELGRLGNTLRLAGTSMLTTMPGLGRALRGLGDALFGAAASAYTWRREQKSAIEVTEEMVRKIIDEGVPGFNLLTASLENFTRDGLEEAWRAVQKWTKANSTLSKAGEIDKWLEDTYRAANRVIPPAKKLAEGLGDLGKQAKAAGVGLNDLVQSLVAVHPAVITAAMDVAYWQSQIARINLALLANRDQLKAAQAEYERMGESLRAAESVLTGLQSRLGELNEQLSEQKNRLLELADVRLRGMSAYDAQIAAVERQLKRLGLAELGLPSIEKIKEQYAGLRRRITEGGTVFTVFGLSTEEAEAKLQELRRGALDKIMAAFPEMTAEMRTYLSTLPLTEEGLQEVLKQLTLTKDLKFDEALAKIKEAAEGVKTELTFEEALKQIGDTKDKIASLTGEISAQEAAIRLQQSAVDAITASMAAQQRVIDAIAKAADALNAILATYQERLGEAQIKQGLLNDALSIAYQWFIDDREKVSAMGAEGVRVAGVMDEKTRALLASIDTAASDTTSTSNATLAAMVSQYKLDMARAVSEVGLLSGEIRAIPTTWTTVHTLVRRSVDETTTQPRNQPVGYQHGGAFVVQGSGPPDSQLVSFRASPGERVTITPPGQGGSNIDYDRLGVAVARALRGQAGRGNVNQTINNYGGRSDAGQSYLSLRASVGV